MPNTIIIVHDARRSGRSSDTTRPKVRPKPFTLGSSLFVRPEVQWAAKWSKVGVRWPDALRALGAPGALCADYLGLIVCTHVHVHVVVVVVATVAGTPLRKSTRCENPPVRTWGDARSEIRGCKSVFLIGCHTAERGIDENGR